MLPLLQNYEIITSDPSKYAMLIYRAPSTIVCWCDHSLQMRVGQTNNPQRMNLHGYNIFEVHLAYVTVYCPVSSTQSCAHTRGLTHARAHKHAIVIIAWMLWQTYLN